MISKDELKKALKALAVSIALMMLLLAIAATLTEKGSLTETWMQPASGAALFAGTLTASLIYNFRRREGRIIRGFAVGILYFAILFLAGKSSGAEAEKTGYTILFLVLSVTGGIMGAGISNKKRRYRR